MNATFRIAIALLVGLLAGVSAATPADEDPESRLSVNGGTRSYRVHVPLGLEHAAQIPLVVQLHGGLGNAASAAEQTGFDALSNRYRFIVAYPDGSGMLSDKLLTWNAGSCCGYSAKHAVDETAFIRAMVAKLQTQYRIDPNAIYAAGMSNGGMMSYRLGCEASDLFAAIAVVSGVQVVGSCKPAQPLSVLHIHGAADQNVPLAGGVGAKALDHTVKPPVRQSIDFWVRFDACASPPLQSKSDNGRVSLSDWRDCRSGSEVLFEVVDGGSHAWPGGKQMRSWLDKPSDALNASEEIWKFFAAHRKSTAPPQPGAASSS